MYINKEKGAILRPMKISLDKTIYSNQKGPAFFIIMMRFNFKIAVFCMCIAVLIITLTLWTRCGDLALSRSIMPRGWDRRSNSGAGDIYAGEQSDKGGDMLASEEIDCHINNDYTIPCRKEGDEIYFPFSFIHKYFEVYGKLAIIDGTERFEWAHSYSKVYTPKEKYDPRGIFMYFENYNVEVRDRVKCISAIEGVPISTQWESQGYYYPTQIAQFGLSHYSKNLTEPEPRRKIIENGENVLAKWFVPSRSTLERVVDSEINNHVLKFTTSEIYSEGVLLKMDHVLDFILSIDILLRNNSSITVVLQNREKKENYNLHYITSDLLISAQDENIYHGIGAPGVWKHLTRDLLVDLQKGLLLQTQDKSKRKLSRSKLKVVSIILRGYGSIDNVTLSSSEHISQFYSAAQWFVKHQDSDTGGWPNPVKRRVAAGFAELKHGWYSAMGQGHAISVLARAYYHSGGDQQYLRAAMQGLKPFRVKSSDGGVLATFLSKYPWYEEYPTRPASFVLNGFIFSLLGLYDLKTMAPAHQAAEAAELFDQGMASLKALLMLYDTGSGTSYDLRHFTLRTAPNLARWDYHATHVNQLLLLSTLDSDPILQTTAERWLGYMTGKRASHN